ncbi:putative mitogen activated protein kinase [Trypanosoma vivax]|nr:putative mitogen activated protein kinase [Trypanosoma vivax]
MEAYETLGVLGEGTYGVVVKARHRATGHLVAIKKYKQAEDDDHVRKTSLREVRVLKHLRHPNVISLLDVFRRDGKLYLVFEYVENTILQLIEARRSGLSEDEVRRYTFQLLNGVSYCHAHNIIHRDVKPENVLVSKDGVLKLCDFGFARPLSSRGNYTDYVATRWYRAPELLVGDVSYGKAVDIWAIGCIFSELTDGQPLFPGDSDLEQLSLIMRTCGPIPQRMVEIFEHNSLYRRVVFPHVSVERTLRQRFSKAPEPWLEFLSLCLRTDPAERPTCTSLMGLEYFTKNNFRAQYEAELRTLFQQNDPTVDCGSKANSPNSLVGKSQALGEHGEANELTLPLLAVPQSEAETAEVGVSGGSKNTFPNGGVSEGVVGESGLGESTNTPFQQLGALWSHYIGSAVGTGSGGNGELPNIDARKSHFYQSVHAPNRHNPKDGTKTERRGAAENSNSSSQGMKVTGGLVIGGKNGPPYSENHAPNSSGLHNGQFNLAHGSHGGHRSEGCKSGHRARAKPDYMAKSTRLNNPPFPILPNEHATPLPAPYVTLGGGTLNTVGLSREGNVTGSKVALSPNANTLTTTTEKNDSTNKGNSHLGGASVTSVGYKHKKKHQKRNLVSGNAPESSPGTSGSYHGVTGHKYSLRDAPSKR